VKRILFSLPTSPAHPFIHKQVVMASWRLLADRRYQIHPMCPSHNPFENNLHHIVNDFLEGDYDFWLSIDHDNPPLNNVLDLIEYNRDIVGFPTQVWNWSEETLGDRPIYWNAYDYVPEKDAYKEHLPQEGLQNVDAIGTGCFLVARRVLLHPDMIAPFIRTIYPDGTVHKGPDLTFCEKARSAGFEIFCAYDYPCDHMVGYGLGLNEIVRAFRGMNA